MKEEKFQALVQQISWFVGDWYMQNNHIIFLKDFQQAFPNVKKKNLKKAVAEVYDLVPGDK